MYSLKGWFSFFLKHGAPVGLFVLIPLLTALYLGHNIITLEQNKHISELSAKIEDNLADIESEISPESFLLKVGRGAWCTFNRTRGNRNEFWDYYRNLNGFLKTKSDIYFYDGQGSMRTPSEFNLKSKYLATKLWELITCSYEERVERFARIKLQIKGFLGYEFRPSDFLDGRDRLIPIIVNSKSGYIYWMNSLDNPKEGILLIFWDIPSDSLRLHNILKRYSPKFDAGFLRDVDGGIEHFVAEKKGKTEGGNPEELYVKTVILGQKESFIDEKGIVWKFSKVSDFCILAGLQSKNIEYGKYHKYFIGLIVFLAIVITLAYIFIEKQDNLYISIRVKLVGLFLIAVFTPVIGFGFIGYQYVSDMRNNLYTSVWNEGRDILLNIDRELGRSGNVFRDDFRKLAEDFQHYDSNPESRKKINESLEKHELCIIERRLASDASLISYIHNSLVFDKIMEVTEAFSKCCIDTTTDSNLMDDLNPALRNAMKSPESALTSFWSKPDNVQDFVFGATECYIYWVYIQNMLNQTEFFLAMRATDKVLREHLRQRLIECKTNPKEKNYIIVAYNNKTGELFPSNAFYNALKTFARRVEYMGKPIENEIELDSKKLLLLGLKSTKLRGYSFYAFYPHEKIEAELNGIKRNISLGIIFFVFTALAIGFVLSETFLYPVKRLGDGVKAIKARDSDFRIESLQNDEFGALALSFNKMIGDLKEMQLAKYIQESLLPNSIPQLDGYELCFSNRMASAIGGDYFDAILLDNEHLCIIIGDVSGHGVASALVMAIAKAIFYHGFNETRNLLELFGDLNSVVNTYFNKPPVKKMITLFATIIHLPSGKAVFTDAGHNFPMQISVNGEVTELNMVGLPVGVLKKIRKQTTEEFTLDKGETLVFYTDGIIEVTGHSEEQYGYDRFKKRLSEMPKENANNIMNRLLDDYDQWLSDTEPDDDVTLVVLKRSA